MGALPPALASALQAGGNARAMFRGAEAGLKSMFPQFIEYDIDGNENGFNYDKFFEEMGTVTVQFTQQSLTDLTNRLRQSMAS